MGMLAQKALYVSMETMTPEQCRAGRALLFWSQKTLAINAGLGISTIYDFERDRRGISQDAVRSIRLALEVGGIVFNDNGSVKLRKGRKGTHTKQF